jgi:hypothetical protein
MRLFRLESRALPMQPTEIVESLLGLIFGSPNATKADAHVRECVEYVHLEWSRLNLRDLGSN